MESIDRNKNDPFYRYQMPGLIIRHSKSRTYLENVKDLFKVLTKYADNQKKRKSEELMKWFSYALSATVKETNLSGLHPEEKIIESLHKYIESYVLCGSCSNPETTLYSKGKELFTHCKACGKDTIVKTKHAKYNKYLIKLLA
jgi:translation initiation factor 2 beta subunit (eIF-2beta)/eIF-5